MSSRLGYTIIYQHTSLSTVSAIRTCAARTAVAKPTSASGATTAATAACAAGAAHAQCYWDFRDDCCVTARTTMAPISLSRAIFTIIAHGCAATATTACATRSSCLTALVRFNILAIFRMVYTYLAASTTSTTRNTFVSCISIKRACCGICISGT